MNDLEFVRRCIEKDSVAWDEFLHKYSKLIYNYIHSTLKIKGKNIPPDSIEDLYQDIIFSLIKENHKKLKMFKAKNGCSLATWLRIVVVNFTIDYLRRTKPLVSIDEDLGEDTSLKDTLQDPSFLKFEQEIAEEERKRHLSECIEELDVDDKYFLAFYIGKQLPLEELKSILGISQSAVDMRKSRLTQRLRECFKKKGFLLGS